MAFFQSFLGRLISGLAVVLAASLLAFSLLETAPGNTARALLGDQASQEQITEFNQVYGFDQSLLARYFIYIRGALQGDLGKSLSTGRPVEELVLDRFKNTAALTLFAMTLSVTIGLTAGVWTASFEGRGGNLAFVLLTAVFLSIPGYGMAIFLAQVFAVDLGWLPALGGGSWRHIILPGVTLALPSAAVIARLTRSELRQAARHPSIRCMRGMGVPRPVVLRRDVFRLGLGPVLAVLGLQLGHLLAGAYLIEAIFAWPGLGRLTVQAVFSRDYPLVMGAVIVSAVLFQALNGLTDMIHTRLDPRLRVYEKWL